jgi:hypothetical protein
LILEYRLMDRTVYQKYHARVFRAKPKYSTTSCIKQGARKSRGQASNVVVHVCNPSTEEA